MSDQTPVDETGDLVAFFMVDLGPIPPGICAGTLVAVAEGLADVAALAAADVLAGPDGVSPITWLARRSLRGDLVRNPSWLPVLVAPGALAPGVPDTELALSPTTLLWIDGALYPVGCLVNGNTIRQLSTAGRVDYCLPLSDGALVQAYGASIASLDDWGWVNAYSNCNDSPASLPTLIQRPRATAAMALAMRNRLAARANVVARNLTDDPDLRLWMDGVTLRPIRREGDAFVFSVPEAAKPIRIVSRSMIPAELPGGGSDARRLGVCVTRLSLRGPDLTLEIQPASGQLNDGFYPPGPNRLHCWTDGFALVPPHFVDLMDGAFELTVHVVASSLRYYACDTSPLPRALALDASLPTPDRDAGSNVMVEHIRILQSLGFAVTFVPADNFARFEPYASALEALGVEVIHRPWYDRLEHFLAERGDAFQLAYVHRLTVAEGAIPLLRRMHPKLPIIYNTADLHHLRRQRLAALSGDAAEVAAAAAEQAGELAAIAAADATLLCNSVEMDLMRAALPDSRLVYLPWVRASVPGPRPRWAERAGMMFLGGFHHPPNVDAMLWFVDAVMPLLRARDAGIVLTIYGADLPPEIAALAADDVKIGGYLPALAPAFDRHRVSVAPLRYGAGFKGKVAESLAYGVPVVGTPIAAEGTGLEHDVNILVAADAEAMATAILHLYRDEETWNRLVAAGQSYLAEALSPDAGRRVLGQALRDAGVVMPA